MKQKKLILPGKLNWREGEEITNNNKKYLKSNYMKINKLVQAINVS